MRVSAPVWQRVDTVLRTAECVASVARPPEAAPGRAWFAIGGARKVVSVVSVGVAGDARLEAFEPVPSGPTGPADRPADARDSVVAAVATADWGSFIAVARGCGAAVMRLSFGEAGASLEVVAWLPDAAQVAIEGITAQGSAETPVLVCGDESGCVTSWKLAPLELLGAASEATAAAQPAWTLLHREPRAHGSLCSALVSLAAPPSSKGATPVGLSVTGGHDQQLRMHVLAPGRPPLAPVSLQRAAEAGARAEGKVTEATPASRMANPPFCNALAADTSSGLVAAAVGDGSMWLLSIGPYAGAVGPAPRESAPGIRPVPVLVAGGAADALRAEPAGGATPATEDAAAGVSGRSASGAGAAAASEAVTVAGTPPLVAVPGPEARLGWSASRGRIEAHLSPCVDVRLVTMPSAPGRPASKPAPKARKPGKRASKPTTASSSGSSSSSSLKVTRRVLACTLALDGEISVWEASQAAAWAGADVAAEAGAAGATRSTRRSGKKTKAATSGFRPASLSKPCEVPLLGRFRLDRAVNQAAFATLEDGTLVVVAACPDASVGVIVAQCE